MADTLEKPSGAAQVEGAPVAAVPAGGIKSWMPLIVTVITMPLLAFATARFVILPKLQHSMGNSEAGGEATAEHGAEVEKKGSKLKFTVPLTKMLVNISGTMGTRYLLTSVTLVSSNSDLKTKVEENKDQLMDLATGTLSSKTISDLEKPGARNVIRAELLTVLNTALGGSLIQEIYITELAIQ